MQLPRVRRGDKHATCLFVGLHHTNAGGIGVEEKALRQGQARMAGWRALAEEIGCSIEAMAVGFAALPRVVSMVVMGMKTAGEVQMNVAAAAEAATIPPGTWREAQRRGLLPAQLPLP